MSKTEGSEEAVTEIKGCDAYLKQPSYQDLKIKENALKYALDIRKFEIDLYWKRATYF